MKALEMAFACLSYIAFLAFCPSVLLPLRYVVGVSLDVVFPDYEI